MAIANLSQLTVLYMHFVTIPLSGPALIKFSLTSCLNFSLSNSLVSIILVVCFILLPSCHLNAPERVSSKHEAFKTYTAASSRASYFKLTQKNTLAISQPIDTALPRGVGLDPMISAYVIDTIGQSIQSQGFKLVDVSEADYKVEPTIVYGNQFGSSFFMQRFGIAPELGERSSRQRASLVLIMRNPIGSVVWRAAVQMYGSDGTVDEATRRERIRGSVSALIQQLPVHE